jgi:leader peptidase (prepilin peptidase)/N-methyltransferase
VEFDFLIIYTFVIGLLMGSFYNVCIYRIPKGESIAFPPSHCTNCNTRLKSLDLVPVFSYIFLGRKCRYCGEKISGRYALVELLTGLAFAGLYIKYGLSFEFLKLSVMVSFLIIIGLIDYDTTDVYTVTTWSGIVSGILFAAAGYFMGYAVLDYVYGALLGGGVITAIILLTKGMGWGDVEICILGGIYLGFANSIIMLFFSFVLGGIIGIMLIATGKKSRKDYIPFGPYIALGAVIAALVGDIIVKWYWPY